MGQVVSAVLPAVVASATSAKVVDLGVIPAYESSDNAVERITLVSPTTQAAQGAANYAQIQVRMIPQLAGGAPGTPVVLGTLNLGTTALTADTPVNLTLANPAPSNLVPGNILDVFLIQTGTGGALAANTEAQVELE